MKDPTTFTPKQILSAIPAQKRLVILGTSSQPCASSSSQSQAQAQAIIIINPKPPTLQSLNYKKVDKIFENDIYSRFDVIMQGSYEIQAIYPVTEKHIKKYKQKKMIYVSQSATAYKEKEKELLEKQLKYLGWVDNIINGTAEADRVLFKCNQFLILPDFKFSDLKQIDSLHLLVIFCDKNLHSIRDLRSQHISLLQNCQKEVNNILFDQFGLEKGSCRMFFHYPPTFYQLHLHVTNLRSSAVNSLVERAHLLQNVLSNLIICPSYYSQVELVKVVEKQI